MKTIVEYIAYAMALLLSALSFGFSLAVMLVLLYFTGVGGVLTIIHGDIVVGVEMLFCFAALCLLGDAMCQRTFGFSLFTKHVDASLQARVDVDIARAYDKLHQRKP